MTSPWIVYGTGTIARAIIAHAHQEGHTVAVAGRHDGKVFALAAELGIPQHVVNLRNATRLRRLLDQAAGIINTAGPFHTTSTPLLRAALDTGTHYVDLSNEWATHQVAHALHNDAARAGIMIIPGAGFGTHAAETLAHHLTAHTNPTDLGIALGTRQGPRTHATRETTRRILKTPPRIRSEGHLTVVRDFSEIRATSIPGIGERTLVPIADGNLSALTHTLTVPNIVVYATITLPAPIARLTIPITRLLAPSHMRPRHSPTAPMIARTTQLWGYSWDRSGHRHTRTLITDDSAAYTAEIVTAVLNTTPQPGTHTPHQLLSNTIDTLPEHTRILPL